MRTVTIVHPYIKSKFLIVSKYKINTIALATRFVVENPFSCISLYGKLGVTVLHGLCLLDRRRIIW